MIALLQALGGLIGTILGGFLQGVIALIGALHTTLEARFGSRVWIYYIILGVLLDSYLLGGAPRLLLVCEQLLALGLMISAVIWMLRSILGGGGGGGRRRRRRHR